MCSSPPSTVPDTLPSPQETPQVQVCALHVPEATGPRLQYTPTGPSLEARLGSEGARVPGRSRAIIPLQLQLYLSADVLVLIQPPAASPLGDNPILQEVQKVGSLSVLVENDGNQELHLQPGALVRAIQEVASTASTIDAETSPPPEATTHADFDALLKAPGSSGWWLTSVSLTRRYCNGTPIYSHRVLLQFADVISIGGYGETNLLSHAITVNPGTTPIKMKHRPLNPVMEESLRQQIDRWLNQRVVEEADSLWSFPLVPVPKKNSKEIRWAVDYRRLNSVTKKDAFPLPDIADNLSCLSGSRIFSALDVAGALRCRYAAPTEKRLPSGPLLANTNSLRCHLA